jgi:phage gp36-like protein
MAFTQNDLLLTDARLAQLTAALANIAVTNPLQVAIDEAIATVARLTAGYVVAVGVLNSWTRSVALYKAWLIAGAVPEDIRKDYELVMKELQAIAAGDQANLPLAGTVPVSATGSWGSTGPKMY